VQYRTIQNLRGRMKIRKDGAQVLDTLKSISYSIYLRKIWDKDWLFEGQNRFRQGYSCESHVIMVYHDSADSVDNSGRLDIIIIDFLKVLNLVPHDRLPVKIAASGMDLRVVVRIR
jgi:hypothetical protein